MQTRSLVLLGLAVFLTNVAVADDSVFIYPIGESGTDTASSTVTDGNSSQMDYQVEGNGGVYVSYTHYTDYEDKITSSSTTTGSINPAATSVVSTLSQTAYYMDNWYQDSYGVNDSGGSCGSELCASHEWGYITTDFNVSGSTTATGLGFPDSNVSGVTYGFYLESGPFPYTTQVTLSTMSIPCSGYSGSAVDNYQME